MQIMCGLYLGANWYLGLFENCVLHPKAKWFIFTVALEVAIFMRTPFLGKPISILHWLNRQQFRWLHSHLLLMAYQTFFHQQPASAILMVIPISAIPDGLSHLKSLF